MAWQRNGTPNTATGTTDDLSITDGVSLKFNVILGHYIPSGSVEAVLDFDGNSSNVWASRRSNNGGSDVTEINQPDTTISRGDSGNDQFGIVYFVNISGEEKLIINFTVNRETAGAGNAPSRGERVSKYTTTAGQITELDITNISSGDFATDSNASALGTD